MTAKQSHEPELRSTCLGEDQGARTEGQVKGRAVETCRQASEFHRRRSEMSDRAEFLHEPVEDLEDGYVAKVTGGQDSGILEDGT
ncbi:hypothetical protein QQ045_016416 [Rhodiola kirilowii]